MTEALPNPILAKYLTYFMIASQSSRLERYLLACELFTPEQVSSLLERRRNVGGSLTEIIVLEELAEEEVYLQALANAMNLEFVKPGNTEIEQEVLLSLPTKAVFQYKVIPFAADEKQLDVLINDPFRAGVTDALRLAAGKRVRFVLCPLAEIEKVSKKFYGTHMILRWLQWTLLQFVALALASSPPELLGLYPLSVFLPL